MIVILSPTFKCILLHLNQKSKTEIFTPHKLFMLYFFRTGIDYADMDLPQNDSKVIIGEDTSDYALLQPIKN